MLVFVRCEAIVELNADCQELLASFNIKYDNVH